MSNIQATIKGLLVYWSKAGSTVEATIKGLWAYGSKGKTKATVVPLPSGLESWKPPT